MDLIQNCPKIQKIYFQKYFSKIVFGLFTFVTSSGTRADHYYIEVSDGIIVNYILFITKNIAMLLIVISGGFMSLVNTSSTHYSG